jgi:hypothetical protein
MRRAMRAGAQDLIARPLDPCQLQQALEHAVLQKAQRLKAQGARGQVSVVLGEVNGGLDEGGVVLNLGSAVIMPEVFLKALTVARNLGGGKPAGFTAVDCDMIRHYRPRLNVVERPTRAGGTGYLLTGHHELLIPLIVWGVDAALDRR